MIDRKRKGKKLSKLGVRDISNLKGWVGRPVAINKAPPQRTLK
jgi:hypothetical protein